jgi:hypothetical protein
LSSPRVANATVSFSAAELQLLFSSVFAHWAVGSVPVIVFLCMFWFKESTVINDGFKRCAWVKLTK